MDLGMKRFLELAEAYSEGWFTGIHIFFESSEIVCACSVASS
jgi:hypothetical protein